MLAACSDSCFERYFIHMEVKFGAIKYSLAMKPILP
jgi:hypothetical protein